MSALNFFCSSKTHFLSLLIADLIHLSCSFLLSHPLYFSYFIFFSPYIFKLLSFLSPLLLTSFFVSIAFVTSGDDNFSNLLFLFKKECSVQNEGSCLEDLGMYEILFGSYIAEEHQIVEVVEEKVIVEECHGRDDPVSSDAVQETCEKKDEKRMENFLKILDQFEKMASNVDEKKKDTPLCGARTNKVVKKIGSKATIDKANVVDKANSGVDVIVVTNTCNGGDRKEESTVAKAYPRAKSGSDGSFGAWDECDLGRNGSMRKEKEWRRTLACKLYEERHNVDGSEGMDSLWEAYEMEANKPSKTEKKMRMRSKTMKREVDRDVDDDEEEEEIEGPLCCLQAIKFSTGKMKLGMGRPNLVKITKAIKGIGWLHKQSKKVHNNGDRY